MSRVAWTGSVKFRLKDASLETLAKIYFPIRNDGSLHEEAQKIHDEIHRRGLNYHDWLAEYLPSDNQQSNADFHKRLRDLLLEVRNQKLLSYDCAWEDENTSLIQALDELIKGVS